MMLIPYQVSLLKKEHQMLIDERKALVEAEKGREDGTIASHEEDHNYDAMYHTAFRNTVNRTQRIYQILTSSQVLQVVKDYNEEEIQIGTTFNVCFIEDGELESEETFTLIEQKVSTESSTDGFVSMEGAFGQAICRKRTGDSFAYAGENGYLISGVISKIYTKEEHKRHLRKISNKNKTKYKK